MSHVEERFSIGSIAKDDARAPRSERRWPAVRALPIITIALASFTSTACVAGPEDADERTAEVGQDQLDPQVHTWLQHIFTFADGPRTPFAVVTVVNRETRQYQPGIEYWVVNRDALGLLGLHPLDVTSRDATSAADPPDPDYLDAQRFTQIEFPTSGWGTSWTVDPLSGGALYEDGNGIGLRLFTSTTGNVSEIAWYQVIPSTQGPRYLAPGGRFSPLGTSVSVPRGYLGYDIDQVVP
ncbi:Hypothetical protein A7982_01155 [Minicystis rosea]|nr:Hypothetical protein A7982_01155 [Minicystis rosea]